MVYYQGSNYLNFFKESQAASWLTSSTWYFFVKLFRIMRSSHNVGKTYLTLWSGPPRRRRKETNNETVPCQRCLLNKCSKFSRMQAISFSDVNQSSHWEGFSYATQLNSVIVSRNVRQFGPSHLAARQHKNQRYRIGSAEDRYRWLSPYRVTAELQSPFRKTRQFYYALGIMVIWTSTKPLRWRIGINCGWLISRRTEGIKYPRGWEKLTAASRLDRNFSTNSTNFRVVALASVGTKL